MDGSAALGEVVDGDAVDGSAVDGLEICLPPENNA